MSKVLEIKIPDSFTEDNEKYVKELANVAIERIVMQPLQPPQADVDAAKVTIDSIRDENGLEKKFEVVKEI
jgi:hypothetical protein